MISSQLVENELNGQYKCQKVIGKGSFATVFEALTKNNEKVAIKVINLQILPRAYIPYMDNEIEILEKSYNNNIIGLIEYKKTDTMYLIVLEFCIFDLNHLVKKYENQKLPIDLCIQILRQISCGLSYLHENNVIHRDLKLENIGVCLTQEQQLYLNKNNQLNIHDTYCFKLLDLGVAKKFKQNDQYTQTFAGTSLFMAPEIIEEKQYSYQADMYSLGICMFLLLTGEYPFINFSSITKQIDLIKYQQCNFLKIEDIQLREIIQKMLKYDPNERLNWIEFYQNEYFQIKEGQLITKFDIQYQQYSQLYINMQEQNKRQSKMRFKNKNDKIQNQSQTINLIQQNEQIGKNVSSLKIKELLSYSQMEFVSYNKILMLLSILKDSQQLIEVIKKYNIYTEKFQQLIQNLVPIVIVESQRQIKSLKHLIQTQKDENSLKDFNHLLNLFVEGYMFKECGNLIHKEISYQTEDFSSLQQEDISYFFNNKQDQLIIQILENIITQYDLISINNLHSLQCDQIKNQIYLIIINIIKLKGLAYPSFQKVDYKYLELRIEKNKQNKDELIKIIDDLIKIYQIIYDIPELIRIEQQKKTQIKIN